MYEKEKLGIVTPLMQSFTSIGPMLDMVAIFSIIAIFSGIFLPLVMLMAFLVGFSTINTTYRLSSRFVSNGGYYSYVGKTLGKDTGIFVAILYLAYAMMVIPDVSLFFGNFFTYVLPISGLNPLKEQFVVSVIFSGLVLLLVSLGMNLTLKYTVIAGIAELCVILATSILFFNHPSAGLQLYHGSSLNPGSLWLGLIFGIVAFSGSGSSVFFSDEVKTPSRNIPRALIASYSISGTIMVVASLSLVLFMGAGVIASYTSNPYVILGMIESRLGYGIYLLFIIFATLSTINLSISYLNALKNAFRKMSSENFFGSRYAEKHKGWHILLAVMISAVVSETTAYITGNFYYIFTAIAGAVGLAYITVHLFSNAALFWIRKDFHPLSSMALPALSSAILLASFYYSTVNPQYSISLTNFIFIAVLATAAVAVAAMKLNGLFYQSVHIDALENEVAFDPKLNG